MSSRSERTIATIATIASALIFASALTSQPTKVRDSVGIKIVENPSRLNAPIAFTLGAKPTFDVGALENDPDKEFNQKPSYFRGFRLSDGRVAINDKARVQFFDATGKRLKITGRNGAGPGEFSNINALCRTRGDTVFVSDTRRVSILGKDGDYVNLSTLPPGFYTEGEFCFDDGTLWAGSYIPKGTDGNPGFRITHTSRNGIAINRIAEVSMGITDMLVPRESPVVAYGQRVFLGNAFEHEIRVYSSAGKLMSLVRTADKVEPVTQSQLEDLPYTMFRAGSTEAEKAAQRRSAAANSKTKTWPTYDRIFIDMAGRMWLQDWLHPSMGKVDNWTAFDPEGKLIGRLSIPAPNEKERRGQVLGFGKDEVFLKRYDADGALHFMIYPLVPRK